MNLNRLKSLQIFFVVNAVVETLGQPWLITLTIIDIAAATIPFSFYAERAEAHISHFKWTRLWCKSEEEFGTISCSPCNQV